MFRLRDSHCSGRSGQTDELPLPADKGNVTSPSLREGPRRTNVGRNHPPVASESRLRDYWTRFLQHYRAPRTLGLDLLRVAASLTIVAYHASFRASHLHQGPLKDGYLAVDLFFLLSGYLLAGQAIVMARSLGRTWPFVATFWIRRWLRTLPAYWVVLAVLFVGGGLLGERFGFGQLAIRALFLQSLLEPYPYGVTWSLITEEWFYLVLPLILLIAPFVRGRLAFTLLLGLGLLLPTVIRTCLVVQATAPTLTAFTTPITQPYDRYEGLVLGAILSAASVVQESWYKDAVAQRTKLFIGATVGISILLALDIHDGPWFRGPGLLIFDVLVAATLPFMASLQWPSGAPQALRMGLTFLAELTYPIYLLHLVVLTVAEPLRPHTVLFVPSVVLLLLLSAGILHVLVERPWLWLRSRLLSPRRLELVAS